MKKTTKTMLALALATSTVAFAQQPAPAKPAAPATATQATTASGDPIIVAAGDVSIRKSEFENALKTLPAEYQQYAMGPGKRQFAEDFLRMKMLAAQGMKAGLDKDPEVLSQLELMRANLVANAQLSRMEKDVKVTDADLQKIYDSKKPEYEQVTARHILIAFKGSPAAQPGKAELTEEQAKAKAEDIRKQLAAGANFDELAKKESDDLGSGSRGGELGAFSRGQMVPEFEKAAFEAKVGDVTPVVRTQYGFHVIKVEKHDFTPFADVKESLASQERQKKLQETLEAMKTNANVTFNTAYFGEAPATPAPGTPGATPQGQTPQPQGHEGHNH
ncbi:MAG TPA: peptidylprolyl isomerase [Thermoanaerobaculia bacterium]